MTTSLSPISHIVNGYQDVAINVWDYGGDGPTLILCHCTGTCARVWDPIVAQLLPHFRVLAPDARGHGDSGKPHESEAYAWSHSGLDLVAIVDQLELGDKVYAAGHSAGGAQIAYAQKHHPGLFHQLMLIDAIIAPPSAPLTSKILSKSALRRRANFNSKAEARERFSMKAPMNRWHVDCLEAYSEHGLTELKNGSAQLKCPPEIESLVYLHGGAHDVFEILTEYDSTGLILVTGSDSNVKPLVGIQYDLVPNAQYSEIEGASHFIPQEEPKSISSLILKAFSK